MAKSDGSDFKQKSKRADLPGTERQPSAAELHIWQIQTIRDVLVVASVVGLFWVGYQLRAVTVPLLIALLLAYLFEPLVAWLCRRWDMSRTKVVSLVLILGTVFLLGAMAIIIPLFVQQTNRLVDDINDGSFRQGVARIVEDAPLVPEAVKDQANGLIGYLPGSATVDAVDDTAASNDDPAALVDEADDERREVPDESLDEANPTAADLEALIDQRIQVALEAREAEKGPITNWDRLLGAAKNTLGWAWAVVAAVIGFGLVAFLIPFYFYFFSVWFPELVAFGHSMIPDRNRGQWMVLLEKMDAVVAGFVRGRIVISFIMGVMLAIGWLFCGVPYSIVLGMTVGVFCAVPYLGIIGIPLAVGALMIKEFGQSDADQMATWAILVWPTAVFGVVQLIEGYVLTPLIAGKATNLDPVTILVAVLAGGSVLGVYGMLLAIPLVACGKILINEILLPRIYAWTKGEVKDPLPIDRE